MKIIYEFYKCLDCPYLTSGRTYGTDGRDGHKVFICAKGAFGGFYDGGFGAYGKSYKDIESIDNKCPLKSID